MRSLAPSGSKLYLVSPDKSGDMFSSIPLAQPPRCKTTGTRNHPVPEPETLHGVIFWLLTLNLNPTP